MNYNNQYDRADVESNKIISALGYVGILVVLPLILAPNSRYARYHANQGICLLVTSVIFGLISTALGTFLGFIPIIGKIVVGITGIIELVMFIFMILGIVNALKGKAKPLPIIGAFQIIK